VESAGIRARGRHVTGNAIATVEEAFDLVRIVTEAGDTVHA
jgi:hypothetical protein